MIKSKSKAQDHIQHISVQDTRQGTYKVKRTVIHPSFDKYGPVGKDGKPKVIHDIGVIHLKKPIAFNDLVFNASLPIIDQEVNVDEGKMIGWGSLGYIRLSKGIRVDAEEAKEVDVKIERCQPPLDESFACAKGDKPDNLCLADYGSPLIIDVGGVATVVGLFSHFSTYSCSDPGVIARFLYLSKEFFFIFQYTSNLDPPQPG